MLVRLHVNRREMAKGRKGYIWTIHTSKACIRAKEVEIRVPCKTEYRPDLPHNPKVFVRVNANVVNLGKGKFALV